MKSLGDQSRVLTAVIITFVVGYIALAFGLFYKGLTFIGSFLQLAFSQVEPGFTLLSDGKTFDGWRGYRMKEMPAKGWKVEDRILKKIGGEHGGDIITEETFDNFELSWEWRISKGGNNGILKKEEPNLPNSAIGDTD